MPTAYVEKLAKKHGISVEQAEERWASAKRQAAKQGHEEDYGYITSIFKSMMGESVDSADSAGSGAKSFKAIKQTVEELGDEYKIRRKYSGRGMFGGKPCVGIVGPDSNEIIAVAGAHGLRGARVDNMGLDYIVYWPHIYIEESTKQTFKTFLLEVYDPAKVTRVSIIAEYDVDKRGIIRSPGKFEGEMLFVPYFWSEYLNGAADAVDGDEIKFKVTPEDIKEFPELHGYHEVRLMVDDNGFVSGGTYKNMTEAWHRGEYYIMNANAAVEKPKATITEAAARVWPKYEMTVVVASRESGYNKFVPVFIFGSGHGYESSNPGTSTTYVIDTGLGHKRGGELKIENIVHVTNGEIVKSINNVGLNEKRSIWVMK